MNDDQNASSRLGLIYGLGAYGLWGIIPLYFRLLMYLPPLEVLAHRIVWSFLLLAGVIVARRRGPDVLRALRQRSVMLRLSASTAFIALNWFTYIYAVSVERVVEASLGYFITPLVNVLLGVLFLGERLRPLQVVSISLAALGVVNLTVAEQGLPWIAISLAVSFAFYGLMRKTVAADATLGLFVETMLLTPVALLTLAGFHITARAEAVAATPGIVSLLVLGGLITTIPLLLFAGAARRLRLTTLGFLQYLAPSIQFLLAVAAFGEPFSAVRLATFGFIWTAVGIYSADSLWSYRLQRSLRRQLTPATDSARG